MVTHSRHDTADRIATFRTKPGAVLVSPSVTTGYDFPFGDCEYQIVCKVPFPDSRDPITAARTLVDPRYPSHLAMQALVQMVGRGMRAPTDQCETFIVDAHAHWFLSKHADLAPKWFRRAVRRLEPGTVPTPPRPLGRLAS
jgi:Rad3-related DNA helicase